jgi:hypothetical protein
MWATNREMVLLATRSITEYHIRKLMQAPPKNQIAKPTRRYKAPRRATRRVASSYGKENTSFKMACRRLGRRVTERAQPASQSHTLPSPEPAPHAGPDTHRSAGGYR